MSNVIPAPWAMVVVSCHRWRTGPPQRSNVDSKRRTSPSVPAAINFLTVRKSPSQRRLWNTMSGRCTATAAAMRASAAATDGAKWFVDGNNRGPGFQRRKPLFQMGVRGGGQHDQVEVGRLG